MLRDDMDWVFKALASRERRLMLDVVRNHPGCSVESLAGHFEMSRIGVMKHLKVLEKAGLVQSEKKGRVRKLYFNVVPIQIIYERWASEFSSLWASKLTEIKYRVETGSSGKTEVKRKRHA